MQSDRERGLFQHCITVSSESVNQEQEKSPKRRMQQGVAEFKSLKRKPNTKKLNRHGKGETKATKKKNPTRETQK